MLSFEQNKKRISTFVGLSLLALGLFTAGIGLSKSWALFRQTCPNKDVLSSDGNARLSAVLDQYDDFQHLHLWDAVFPLLDSPTWPPLRAAIALIVFAVLPGGPSQVVDVAISFAFYILLFPSLLYISIRMCRSLPMAGLTFVAAVFLVSQSTEMPMFALSSMLETQGMFFTAWSVYCVWRLWQRDANDRPPLIAAVGLCLSIQGLYHTKYPYGIMFLLAAFVGEVVRYPRFYQDATALAMSTHYKGLRRVLLALFVLVIVALAAAPHVGLPINNKTSKHVMFAVSVVFFIDANVFLFRRRFAIGSPASTAALYKFGAFPALVWLLIHPDRLASTLGTQLRLQEQTRSYLSSMLDFRTMQSQVFDSTVPGIFFGAALVSVLAVTLLSKRRGEATVRLSVAAWALGFSQVLILEFLTGNKQLRHIYHALPVVIVLSGALITQVRGFATIFGGLALGAIIAAAVAHPNGVLSAGYALKQMCFTNTVEALFNPARWVAARTPREGRVVIVNAFHPIMEPLKGRLLATDMDLLVRFKARETRRSARNDSSHIYRSWNDFDSVLFISPDCSAKALATLLEPRAKQLRATLVEVRKDAHPAEKICIVDFKIIR